MGDTSSNLTPTNHSKVQDYVTVSACVVTGGPITAGDAEASLNVSIVHYASLDNFNGYIGADARKDMHMGPKAIAGPTRFICLRDKQYLFER